MYLFYLIHDNLNKSNALIITTVIIVFSMLSLVDTCNSQFTNTKMQTLHDLVGSSDHHINAMYGHFGLQ